MRENVSKALEHLRTAYYSCTNDEIKNEIKSYLINKGEILVDFDIKYIEEHCFRESSVKDVNDRDLKVLHGTIEIANQMNTMAKALRNCNIETKTINYYPNYLGYKSDYSFDVNYVDNLELANKKTVEIAKSVINKFDLFHFHFGTSLALDNSDLPLLKQMNKKVIMQHWGSDIRLYSKAIKMSSFVKVKDNDEDNIKRKLEYLSSYMENCAVCDYELYEYVKDYYDNVFIIPQTISLADYKVINYYNKKPLIVHAPTSQDIKGTGFILKAIENLKLKYDFDFKLVTGMLHEEALKIYQKADLVIDQLLIGSYGLFALESMAMGKPVVCWISDYMKEKYPEDLPIICANPNTIEDTLEDILKNKDMLKDIGLRSRMYIEKHHDIGKISTRILEIYKQLR